MEIKSFEANSPSEIIRHSLSIFEGAYSDDMMIIDQCINDLAKIILIDKNVKLEPSEVLSGALTLGCFAWMRGNNELARRAFESAANVAVEVDPVLLDAEAISHLTRGVGAAHIAGAPRTSAILAMVALNSPPVGASVVWEQGSLPSPGPITRWSARVDPACRQDVAEIAIHLAGMAVREAVCAKAVAWCDLARALAPGVQEIMCQAHLREASAYAVWGQWGSVSAAADAARAWARSDDEISQAVGYQLMAALGNDDFERVSALRRKVPDEDYGSLLDSLPLSVSEKSPDLEAGLSDFTSRLCDAFGIAVPPQLRGILANVAGLSTGSPQELKYAAAMALATDESVPLMYALLGLASIDDPSIAKARPLLLKMAAQMIDSVWQEAAFSAPPGSGSALPNEVVWAGVMSAIREVVVGLVSVGRIGDAIDASALAELCESGFIASPNAERRRSVSLTPGEREALTRLQAHVREATRRTNFDDKDLLVSIIDDWIVNALPPLTLDEASYEENQKLDGLLRRAGIKASSNDACIHYLHSGEQLEAIIHAGGGPIRQPLDLTSADLNKLAFLLLQQCSDPAASPNELLQISFQRLLAPVWRHLGGAPRRLIIAGAGSARLIPFAALHDGARFVVETTAVSYAREAVAEGLDRPPRQPPSLATLAVADAGGSGERLPFALVEVENLSRAAREAGIACVLEAVDGDVTREALRRALSGPASIVHIASHAHADRSWAPASRLLLGNGTEVTLAELVDLDLSGVDLICLSACQTGFAAAVHDRIVPPSFDVAFLRLGAGAVVSTLWNINDGAAAQIISRFYEILLSPSGLDKATSLVQAQRGFLQSDGRLELRAEDFRETNKKHPYYWAAFQISNNRLPLVCGNAACVTNSP